MRIKTFLVVFFLLFSVNAWGAVRYVNPACESACDGTTWAKGWETVGAIVWGDLDNEDSTLYLSGGDSGVTYSTQIVAVHNISTSRLTIRPGSASPEPTGHAGLVTISETFKLGNDLGGGCDNLTIDGETTSGSGTRNIKFSLPTNVGKMAFYDRYAGANLGNILQWVEVTGAGYLVDSVDYTSTKCKSEAYYALGHHCIAVMNGAKFYEGTGTDNVENTMSTKYVVQGFQEVSNIYMHDNFAHSDVFLTIPSTCDSYGVSSLHHSTVLSGTLNYLAPIGKCVDVYNNTFSTVDAPFPYDILHFYTTSGLKYIRVWNNTFDNADQSIFVENSSITQCSGAPCKTEYIQIYNNTFTCTDPHNGFEGRPILFKNNFNAAIDHALVANNTFLNSTYGVNILGSPTLTDFKIENNIFYNTKPVHIETTSNPTWANDTDAVFDYNLIYDADGFTINWRDSTAKKTYTTVCDGTGGGCAWATDHTTYLSNVIGDPVFVSTSDFHIQTTSPAKNAGTDLSALTDMGLGWPNDKDGNVRDATWDIGAYEFGGAADETAPTISSATIGVGGDTLTLVFDEVVTVNTSTGFTLGMSGGAAGLTYTSGSGTNTLVYAITVRTIDTAETGTLDYVTVTNGIEDAAGNDLASTGESDIAVTNNSTHTPSATTYIVTVQSSGNCVVSPLSNKVIVSGETASYTCAANGNSGCAAWTGTCGGTGTTSFTSSAVTGNCTVIQGCYKISPDVAIGSGAAVTLGSGAVGTLY